MFKRMIISGILTLVLAGVVFGFKNVQMTKVSNVKKVPSVLETYTRKKAPKLAKNFSKCFQKNTGRDVVEGIEIAVEYLIKSWDKKTGFVYQVSVNSEDEIKPDYNMVRHAGVVYSLKQYIDMMPKGRNKKAAQKVINEAAFYLVENSLIDVPEYPETKALFGIDAYGKISMPPRASLGGQSLGLIALMAGNKDVSSLIKFVEQMKITDENGRSLYKGRYAHYYRPYEYGKSIVKRSEYYDGEFALALVEYAEKHNKKGAIQEANNVIYYKATNRFNRGSIDADHWSIMAVARLNKYKNELDSDRWIRAWWYANTCMKSCSIKYPDGKLSKAGTSAQTATRIEGMMSGYDIAVPEVKDRIDMVIHDSIEYLMNHQISYGPFKGGVIAGGANSVKYCRCRIDYVQHYLSALLLYQNRYSVKGEFKTVKQKT